MKKTRRCFLIACAMIAAVARGGYAQSVVNASDSLTLEVDVLKWGDIQWQSSRDLVTWDDIPCGRVNKARVKASDSTYYRARVTNGSCQPVYSDTIHVVFRCFVCGDTLFDDRDGQAYPTTKIGQQCWMAKNLNFGMMIPSAQTQDNNAVPEKYCYNNEASYCESNGGLYQWDELMDYVTSESSQGLCPSGWHVPSDAEWKTLELTLGMTSWQADMENTWRGTGVGTSLKVGGSTGYEGLLSGRFGGSFALMGSYEFMYSSTLDQLYPSYVWRRCVRSDDDTMGRWNTFPRSYALSVRCVKN